jgi:hypothetical protein
VRRSRASSAANLILIDGDAVSESASRDSRKTATCTRSGERFRRCARK